MNRKFIWIALAALVLPIVVRLIWLFPGFNLPRSIATPDYASFKMPEAPISTPRPEGIKQTGGEVIIDYAHSNQFQPVELQALTDDLDQRGAHVDFEADSTSLVANLKSANVYVIVSPSIGFTPEETNLVEGFVSRGGRLAVFTDATRGQVTYDFQGNPVGNISDVNITNPLLEPFGITVNADYLYNLVDNEGNFRNVYFKSFGKSDLTWGLGRVVFYGTHSVETDSGLSLLVGNDKTLSSSTDATPGNDPKQGWNAAVLSKDGNVFAAGDFSFLTPPYNTVGDNAILINNIADFLLGGQRRYVLADYPYIFNGSPVDILPTTNVQMTAGITDALSRLQAGLAATNTELQVVKNAPDNANLIVLGTFSLSDDLTKFVEPFSLKLDDASEFVEVPQFGRLGRSGNGLLLYNHAQQGATLILLADTVDGVATLMDTLSSGDLSGCLLQGDVGVCSTGIGGSFTESTTPTPEATPLNGETPVTATPSG